MNPETMQQLIIMAAQRAVNILTGEGRGLAHLQSAAPDNAVLVNGAIIDGQFTPFCLFDDDTIGFDSSEGGFGP